MKKWFVNPSGGWRSGWDILAVVAACFLLTALFSMLFSLNIGGRSLFPHAAWMELLKTSGPYIMIVIVFTVKVVQKRSLSSIGLTRPDGRNFAGGFIFGGLSIMLVLGVLWLLDQLTLQGRLGSPDFSNIDPVNLLITALFAGICEEALFRGYIQHTLARRMPIFLAVLITSAAFSLAHLPNPGYSFLSFLNILLIAFFFSLMTLRTGNIYFAMAYHTAWNLFQGDIFGTSVSGTLFHGIYPLKLSGSSWLTGGDFGLEGGLVTTALLIVLNLLVGIPMLRNSSAYRSAYQQRL
ncbi:hypothetical protein DCC85_05940 [Paenibacillus sp. CAA11]|uniref:type II CAAX endopeptidase family protein n=1 Tax=Paenibacillus sp. CAA11 TaxID=1532905 RepID=UPI000D3C42C0|nr:type II CAAX endopeptidase family protein [Paenibacillus sp. CAA11]AWB43809.1 hypothetical protein DCC85_05940 [Paenibacillus sp. CAA11]